MAEGMVGVGPDARAMDAVEQQDLVDGIDEGVDASLSIPALPVRAAATALLATTRMSPIRAAQTDVVEEIGRVRDLRTLTRS